MAINVNDLDLSSIRTVADLQQYLITFPSPIAAQFINDALAFFLSSCHSADQKTETAEYKRTTKNGNAPSIAH